MTKNGRTLKQDVSIIFRGLKEFNFILPKQMRYVFFRSILVATIPLISTAISAIMIDEIVEYQSRTSLLMFSLSGVTILFFLNLLKNYEDCKIAVGYSRLFSSHEIWLTNKSYRLPYELLEQSSTRTLREEVSGSINLSGAGMASLYWDMDVIFTNTLTACISLIICINYVCKIFVSDYSVNATFINSIKMLFIMILLVSVGSYISCKMTGRRFDVSFEVFQNGSKFQRYGEFYTMNYLSDENAAMDARIYGQERLIVEESQKRCYEHFANGKVKEMNAVNRYDGVRLACSCLCGCIVYMIIGQKALQGIIGCGSIVLMYAAVTMLIQSLSEIAQIVTDLRNNNEHLIRYFQYMDMPEEEGKCEALFECLPTSCRRTQAIAFQNVSFKYPESDIYVLQDVNLEIRAGEKLAIVGENGSGKTTLIKLLCRLYKPSKGRILLNGRDILSYSYTDYIACISTVFQDFSLLAFTLSENVAVSQKYDAGRVKEALKAVGLMGKKMEDGINQYLYHDFADTGTDLSGGEAQKVAIARAIYKNTDIMILDEPTAALDPYAEYEIYKNFSEITTGKTVLSISHRLSSCRMCDRIVVMSHGRVVQCGTHEELLEDREGKYYEMWNAQAKYYSHE